MNRGSISMTVEELAYGLPSMRPRFMNRGSGNGRCSSRNADSPFNEAPIHESGKSWSLALASGQVATLQ